MHVTALRQNLAGLKKYARQHDKELDEVHNALQAIADVIKDLQERVKVLEDQQGEKEEA
jgi:predicted  nucleic acid-binding Zn-ribbon protein